MKKRIALVLCTFTCTAALAVDQNPYPQFEKEVKKLASQYGVKLSDVGARITLGEAEDTVVVYDQNSKKQMIPASITKLATASAVLAHFPPGYKFKTQLLTVEKPVDGVLKGDLYLKGGGDPSFVSENMWYLVNAFKRNEIKSIEGNIIVDDSLFDKVRYDDSRQEKRVDRAYDAPVGAMSFNWNSINIFVRPGKKGEPARVFLDPENDYVRLVNKSKTVAGAGNKLTGDRVEDKKFDGDVIHVGGTLGVSNPEVVVYKNITQPDLWSGYNLKSFLNQRGIQVSGEVKNGLTPPTASVVAEAESKAIEQILADMNKFSNNYVAEMLTKNLGALNHKPASLADGMKVIVDHLHSLQIGDDQFKLQSPSGLTHENKMSPWAFWTVLRHLRDDFQIQPELLTSLPIAGIDGTLKKRMRDSPAERWVRAKTGYVDHVAALAGYAGRKDGKVITFALIYNGSTDEAKVRSFFDKLMIYLVK
jgi:D-alanyl-D-alanine carboxypeptidase/D-alanyl-D-alanine-endopeptidase (penicillin-binding protein 4)